MEQDDKHSGITISMLQVELDDVKNIMTQNIENFLKREDLLTELDELSDDLKTAAQCFQRTTGKVAKKMWWKNTKILIIVAIIFLIIVVFIVLLATGVIPI